MQNDIREKFGKNMKEEALQQFVDLHKNEKLVSPEEPGTVYANLALKGCSEDLNGKYLDFDDALLKDYQL